MAGIKKNATRVGILLAVGGIIFSSAGLTIVLLMQNNKTDSSQQAQLQQQIQDQLKQQKEASMPKEPLPGYEATAFDAASVTELKVETLTQGSGPEATRDSKVTINYFGWTSDGKIFDSSNKGGTVTPLANYPLTGFIKGWTEGLTGVKEGSVVKLTIPADKAYGATGSPPSIGPNQPLVFIVQLTEVK